MELDILFSFIGTAILLAFMPGPDILFVLTESLSKGKRTGISIAMGLVSGIILYTVAVATGLALVIQNSPLVFSIIKSAGAIYLAWLAYKALGEKPIRIKNTTENQNNNKSSFIKLYRKGLIMNLLNPKVLLFFIAFFPQFVRPTGFSAMTQILLLGTIFMFSAFGVFVLVAFMASRFTLTLNQPKFWSITKYTKAVVLFGLAIFILI